MADTASQSDEIPENQAALEKVWSEHLGPYPYRRSSSNSNSKDGTDNSASTDDYFHGLTDSTLVEKARNARNGAKFSALFDLGDKSDYGNDDSRADAALCSMLAFWTQDPSQIDRLFRQSGLNRPKWNRNDYRQRTINLALSGIGNHYTPPSHNGHNAKRASQIRQQGNEHTEAQTADREQNHVAESVELLDAAPPMIRRPLALISGGVYAGTWLYVAVKVHESTKRGKTVRHDPPIPKTERRLVIVSQDGRIFYEGGENTLSALGLEINLPEMPPVDRQWSSKGVIEYHNGRRPQPAAVFARLRDVIDRFIDFDRSLANQETMCSFVSCYILATWLMDAFNVAGYLWPNGDRGSGKTQLITLVCELGYLGQLILAGGSYASLRDLADYGATLAFDDAENLSDPRRTDPDKRALLLAGNRRGNTVPVKEPAGDRTWRTRYVNTFCPRLFTATQLPDAILASRTIVIPLIRTPDRAKANADPLDYKLWPHNRQQLLDDLWALGLSRLHELPPYDDVVSERAGLMGRNLEPWRAVLAVSAWLDDNGVSGLWQTIEQLSVEYQKERPNVETNDMTVLVIRTLCELAGVNLDISDSVDISDSARERYAFKVSDITKAANSLAAREEMDLDADEITSRKIGRTLSQMRIKSDREKGTGQRMRQFTKAELYSWALRYGLVVSNR